MPHLLWYDACFYFVKLSILVLPAAATSHSYTIATGFSYLWGRVRVSNLLKQYRIDTVDGKAWKRHTFARSRPNKKIRALAMVSSKLQSGKNSYFENLLKVPLVSLKTSISSKFKESGVSTRGQQYLVLVLRYWPQTWYWYWVLTSATWRYWYWVLTMASLQY